MDLANFINFKTNKNPKTSLESLEVLWMHVYLPPHLPPPHPPKKPQTTKKNQKPCSSKSLLNGFIFKKIHQKQNKKHKPKKPLNVRRYFNLS